MRMPTKQLRGQARTGGQPRANQALHQRRRRIAPVNGRVKRGRIVKDRLRLWKQGIRDLVMERCCALHNFRVRLTPCSQWFNRDKLKQHATYSMPFASFIVNTGALGGMSREVESREARAQRNARCPPRSRMGPRSRNPGKLGTPGRGLQAKAP